MTKAQVKSILLIMENCQIEEVHLSPINTTGGGDGSRIRWQQTPTSKAKAILELDGRLTPFK